MVFIRESLKAQVSYPRLDAGFRQRLLHQMLATFIVTTTAIFFTCSLFSCFNDRVYYDTQTTLPPYLQSIKFVP